MAVLVLSHLDFSNSAKIQNLPDPTAAQDAATKAYVDATLEGLAWKDSCRVSTQGNINLSAPGATIDGVTLVNGDRILVRQQTSQIENGIYVFNGAATPATRSLDANVFAELESAVVTVEEGTDAGTSWRQTQVNGTLGTDNVVFSSFGTSAPAASDTTPGIIEIATQAEVDTGTDVLRAVTPGRLAGSVWASRKFNATIGDGSATLYTVTHNFGTRDLQVCVQETGGSFRDVVVEVRKTTTNAVDVVFASAPAVNSYRVLVQA